jgi:hypothetical protein
MWEEWDKLCDLLLLLQYPGKSRWGWEEGTTTFQFPTSSCYAQSLVRSECLNDSVAGTIWIRIVGCHFWNPVLIY